MLLSYRLSEQVTALVSRWERPIVTADDAHTLAHPDVQDAGVTGVPDEEWGQRILAFVVLRDGTTCTPEQLRDYVKRRLRSSKTPDQIYVCEKLPRTDTENLSDAFSPLDQLVTSIDGNLCVSNPVPCDCRVIQYDELTVGIRGDTAGTRGKTWHVRPESPEDRQPRHLDLSRR